MSRKVWIVDQTVRDGPQSLWATMLSTEEIVPIARTMDRAGFRIIDLNGGAAFDAAVVHLRENPFERIRVISKLITNTPLNFNSRGRAIIRWRLYSDDVARLFIRKLAENGIRWITVLDPMNEVQTLEVQINAAKEHGLGVFASVVYSDSPYHTDEHFIEKCKQYVKLGVDGVALKDPSGTMRADRGVRLIKGFRSVLRGQLLLLHHHTSNGLSIDVHKAAMDLKEEAPDLYHGAAPPLAWGLSHPSHDFLVENLKARSFEVDVDLDCVKEMSAYFGYIAERRNLPIGRPVAYRSDMAVHGLPGGMFSNLVRQLAEQGMSDRLSEVLEEVRRIRQELGYPILVSPFAQFVGAAAVLNVITKERYKIVPDEIGNYLRGHYGQAPGPIDENVRDRVLQGAEVGPWEGASEPMVENFRREHGPFKSDEDLLLALFYSAPILRASQGVNWNGYRNTPTNALSYLLDRAIKNPKVRHVRFHSVSKQVKVAYDAPPSTA